jgi:hypothetical protein
MAMLYDDVAAIELRRLAELEKQAALRGPQTEPAVLVEIQDLRHKYGTSTSRFVRPPGGRDRTIDFDFLMNTVSAALQRVAAIEKHQEQDGKARNTRQLVLNIWLGAISMGVIVSIALNLWLIQRLFGV